MSTNTEEFLGEFKTNAYTDALNIPNNTVATDLDIVNLSEADGFPMTSFQTENFVVGDAVTPYRMKRQALLEINARKSALHSMEKELRKSRVLLALLERDLGDEADELQKQLIQCDIDELKYDIDIVVNKVPQGRRELQEFINQLKKLLPENATVEDIKNIGIEDPELERHYWISRMAKQAAVDMVTLGRVGSGNLLSIMQMKAEDQKSVMATALTFQSSFDYTMNILGDEARQKLIGEMGAKQPIFPKIHGPIETDI